MSLTTITTGGENPMDIPRTVTKPAAYAALTLATTLN